MKIKTPEVIFATFALIFGLLFLFITPYNGVPDEEAHLMRACEVSDGILYSGKTHVETTKCDELLFKNIQLNRNKFQFHSSSGYSPVLYTFSALGLKFGEIWGGNTMFYLARLFNLIFFILITTLAIRITPVFKYQFLIVALFPMTLFEGMSISADSINIAIAFLFFAYLFKFIFGNKQELLKVDLFNLSILSVLGAMLKGLIYPIFLFVFLPIKRHKILFISTCLILAIGIMSYWSSINPIFTYPSPLMDVNINKYMLLHSPPDFIHKFYTTLITRSYWYIPSCIGILGWLKINLYPAYVIEPILFISSFFIFPTHVNKNKKIVALTIFIIFFILMHIMFYITWTLPNSHKIDGVQGRYFIPMLPLLFMVLAQNKSFIPHKYQNKYISALIVMIFITLCYSYFALYNYFI